MNKVTILVNQTFMYVSSVCTELFETYRPQFAEHQNVYLYQNEKIVENFGKVDAFQELIQFFRKLEIVFR